MSVFNSKVTSTGPLSEEDARWIKLSKITYQDPNGSSRSWESAERRTRPKDADIDGVGIVAILEKPSGPELILQKQYRPPIDKVTIEVPAGLIDAGETAEECAVRELREETGYVGKASETSPMMFNDPGFCNTNLRMVHVTIDMELPENQDLKPQLEDSEFIEVFTVKLADLWEEYWHNLASLAVNTTDTTTLRDSASPAIIAVAPGVEAQLGRIARDLEGVAPDLLVVDLPDGDIGVPVDGVLDPVCVLEAVGQLGSQVSTLNLLTLVSARGLVCVVDDGRVVIGEDLDIGLLDIGKRTAIKRDVLVLDHGLELGGGLEAIVASSSHGQPSIACRRRVAVLFNVQVVVCVLHGKILVFVVPFLSTPCLGELRFPVEVVRGKASICVPLDAVDQIRDTSILRKRSKVSEQATFVVSGTVGLGHVAIACWVLGKSQRSNGEERREDGLGGWHDERRWLIVWMVKITFHSR
ncbi:hypothetical protein HG530_008229 [Fusarium avenaceum]|nr:hypothetical protein HG530_008229 [Fusarium avenaceum]